MKVTIHNLLCIFFVLLIILDVSWGQWRRGPNSRNSDRPSRYRPIPWRRTDTLSSITANNQKISSNIYFRDGKIYYFNNTAVTFDEALNFCELLGMTMVHVRSEDENKFIATFRNCTFSGIWFGVKRSDEDPSKFVWLDSSNITVEAPKEDSYYDQCLGMSRNISNCCSMRQCRYSDCTPCQKWFASPCDQTHMIACEAVIDVNLVRKIFLGAGGDTPFSSPFESDQIDMGALRNELNQLRKMVETTNSPSTFSTSFLVLLVMGSLLAVAVVGYHKFKYVPIVVRGRENLSTLVRNTSNRIESFNKSFHPNARREGGSESGNEYASMVEEPSCDTR